MTTTGLARVAVPAPLYRTFDYLPPDGEPVPVPGSRVLVPFGKRRLVGIVIARIDQPRVPDRRLRPIERVLDAGLVDDELLALLEWATGYYAAPPGELVTHALPALLRRNRALPEPRTDWLRLTEAGRSAGLDRAPRQREIVEWLRDGPRRRQALVEAGASSHALRALLEAGRIERCHPPAPAVQPGPALNRDQRRAVAGILAARNHFRSFLLAGVTGSGKTEVYLQAARHIVRRGRQVLVLVPEIGLTPQFVRRIEARLGRRAHVYHSGLAAGDRLDTWLAGRNGEARLIVGTRSAVFVPLRHPGLIVVDEEHDSSFKQFDGMRYNARDVAVMRASRLGIPVVLGSATPSLESLFNADRERYRMLLLPERAGAARQPEWRIEDPRGRPVVDGLSEPVRERIGTALARGDQVLVFRNRRGFAPVLMCNECGWQADCERCSAHLTWHRAAGRLECHHCGHTRPAPARCVDCGSPDLAALGAGTQRIESALKRAFPDIEVIRVDRDALRSRDAFERLLERVKGGEPCVLVGTQMLAKGHHLPGIALAVVLDTDQMLFSADFRAPERLAQTIVQVAGRAGRVEAGQFVLESRHPDHPLIRRLAAGDYLAAARVLLEERREAGLPPCQALAMIRAESRGGDDARAFLQRARSRVRNPAIEVAGPVSAILQQRAGFWRYQLWLMADARPTLADELAELVARIESLPSTRRVRWHVDVDPLEL